MSDATDATFNEKLHEVMDYFDFDQVAQFFIVGKFGWVPDYIKKGNTAFDVTIKLRKDARRLLGDSYTAAVAEECECGSECGGLSATASPSGELQLRAVVEDWNTRS